jgi:hypothetical protein
MAYSDELNPDEPQLEPVTEVKCLLPNCSAPAWRDSNRCKEHFQEWLVWLWDQVK